MKVIVFGDSITQGLWDAEGGWVERLRREHTGRAIKGGYSKMHAMIFNLGVPGDTAGSVARRLASETQARQWAGEQIVIVIAVGMNDSKIFKGVESNTSDMFAGELRQLTALTRQFTDKVLFVGMAAVDDGLCNPYKNEPAEVCYTNQRISEFEQTLRTFCDEEVIPMVKIRESFEKLHATDGLLADGLHPNAAGHTFIAEQVKPALATMVE
jgi:lysophospholipase L1-like esterase